jgi:hypothetical protein
MLTAPSKHLRIAAQPESSSLQADKDNDSIELFNLLQQRAPDS